MVTTMAIRQTYTNLRKTHFTIKSMDNSKMYLNGLYVMGIKKKADFQIPEDYLQSKTLGYSERKMNFNQTSIIAIKIGGNWFNEEYINQIKYMMNNEIVRVYYTMKDLPLIVEAKNFVIYLAPLIKEQ